MSFGKRRRGGPKWERDVYTSRLIKIFEDRSEGPSLVRRIWTPGCGMVYAATGSSRCVAEVKRVRQGRKLVRLVTRTCTCPSSIMLDDPVTGRRIEIAVRTKPIRSMGGGKEGLDLAHRKARRAAMHTLDNVLNEIRRKCGVGARKRHGSYWPPSPFPWREGQLTLPIRT